MKTTKEMIAVMEAFQQGKQIQHRAYNMKSWQDSECPNWNWPEADYRIHPKHNTAPGHNPAKRTIEQVGDGYRLLDPDEILKGPELTEIECWSDFKWSNGYCGNVEYNTYRTRLSREELHKLRFPPPKTTRRVPLRPADFPPGTLLRCSKEYPNIPWIQYAVQDCGLIIWWPNNSLKRWTYDDLTILYLERSLDGGKTWLPCYKEVTE